MSEETRDVLDIEPGLSRWVDDSKLYEEADVERLKEEIRRLREALRDTLSALDYVVMTDFQDRRYGVGWDRIEKHRALLPPYRRLR